MTTSSPSASDPTAIERAASFGASLVEHLSSDEFLPRVSVGLHEFVQFKNFIVFAFREGFAADLVYTNLDHEHLRRQMRPYIDGLFLLDPFYISATADRRPGLLQLSEVAPEDFEQSEFFQTFYGAVDVYDELHYVVPIAPGRSVHVFLERELPAQKYATEEIACLQALEPIVTATIRAHWRWRDGAMPRDATSPIQSAGGIDAIIRAMKPGELTQREVEVVGLSLRGHSSKLIGRALGISDGTVTNHKRNVYEKLGVHSQSQLFSLFLSTLSDGRREPG